MQPCTDITKPQDQICTRDWWSGCTQSFYVRNVPFVANGTDFARFLGPNLDYILNLIRRGLNFHRNDREPNHAFTGIQANLANFNWDPQQSAKKSSSWGISIQHLHIWEVEIHTKLVKQSFRVSQAGEAFQNHAQHQALQYPMHTPSRFCKQGIKGNCPFMARHSWNMLWLKRNCSVTHLSEWSMQDRNILTYPSTWHDCYGMDIILFPSRGLWNSEAPNKKTREGDDAVITSRVLLHGKWNGNPVKCRALLE